MNRLETFLERLPFEVVTPPWRLGWREITKPFIETGEGKTCHKLLLREQEKLLREGDQWAAVSILEDGIELRWDVREHPYRWASNQYKGVALRPNPNGGVDVYYTWLGAVGTGETVTDWVIYRAGVPVRNGISETLRAAGMLIDLSGVARESTLSEHIDMAMMFAWHHPHNFSDGQLNPKR